MSQQSGNSSPLLESVWHFWNSVPIVSWGVSYIGNICTANHHWSFGCNSEVCQFVCRVLSSLVLSCLLLSCFVLPCLVSSYLPILHNLCKGNISFKPVNWQANHRPALIITLYKSSTFDVIKLTCICGLRVWLQCNIQNLHYITKSEVKCSFQFT